MKDKLLLFILSLFFLIGCQIHPSLPLPALLQRNTVAVLETITEPISDRYAAAAGTIIYRKKGDPLLILTAQHVVDGVGPYIVNVELRDSQHSCKNSKDAVCLRLEEFVRLATLPIYSDRVNDIAVLVSAVNWYGEVHPTSCLAGTDPVENELTWTTGSPGRVPYVLTAGEYVRKLTRTHPITRQGLRTTYLINTTAGYYGASGGGTFNRYGEILGVNSTLTWLGAQAVLSPSKQGIKVQAVIIPGFLNVTTRDTLRPVFNKFNLCQN